MSEFRLVRYGAVTDEQRDDLEGDEIDPFGGAGSTMHYRSKERHVGLQGADGRLVAQTGMVVTEVEVAGTVFPVVGLGGVIVRAEHRGRGLAREALEAALADATGLGPTFALLFCLPDRAGLYLRLGFSEVNDPVVVMQPDRRYVAMPDPTMWRSLDGTSVWPDGAVTVRGLPF
jgi:predicted N-acetyltransferase YhbS